MPVLALLSVAACDMPEEGGELDRGSAEIDDLVRIRERGTLRVLRPQQLDAERLPRAGHAFGVEELVAAYARDEGLEARWVSVDSRADLIPALLDDRGDMIAGNLTVTDERKRQIAFTVPVATVRQQIVTRADDHRVKTPADLAGRTIAVRRSSPFWQTVRELRGRHPEIGVELVPEPYDAEEIIRRVAAGEYDLTVADSDVVQGVLTYRDDVKPVLDLTRERPVAWAVRHDSRRLLGSLNRFLSETQLARRPQQHHTGDLDEIRNGRTLRVLTRNNAATYFVYRGELIGFEYEFVREFARRQGLRLEMIVPPSGDDLLPWLLDGRGDLIAAALTPTAARRAMGVQFSQPYNFVSQLVVARADEDRLTQPADLAGRSVVVRPSSAYRTTLEQLRYTGIDVAIVDAPEQMETSEIIDRVASGEFDLTLADSHIVEIELTWRDDVRAVFALTEEKPLGWVVRGDNPQLLGAVNDYIEEEYRGLFYNVIYDRYFNDEHRIRRHYQAWESSSGELSPYDALIRRYAERYGFDWRLIVALMYQESRFDPLAVSFAGARGLMQVLPGTALELGVGEKQMDDPEASIRVGVRYLAWLRDRFDQELPVRDRMWLSLAAYNAGYGHVSDARRIAAEQGLNPNRWFGNVERAMLLLDRPDYARDTRFGYCRCTEPVNYVREIVARYNAYIESARAGREERAAL
ncbi:MAG TPA: transporter substrate-binding domain-containing protein [Candidatus Polarisedimenticolaceae bacterium]|nr:transporter substrate-binding domain-containing protein [Candidatus Polarisedimenticolaceae bacterium]